MSHHVSARSGVEPFHVMEVVAAAAARGDVVHLEVGQPSDGAPPSAVARAQELLASGDALGYTPALGITALRERIAGWYHERYGLETDPGRIAVTAGASGAVMLALLARFDPGQRIAYAVPGYPCYPQLIAALGLIGVPVPCGAADGFVLGAEQLDRLIGSDVAPIDGVFVASPANPTGTQYDPEQLRQLAQWCRDRGVQLIADELYHGITFDRPAPSAGGDESAIVIGSFSKYFCMTGWRLGWMLGPAPLIDAVDRLSQHAYLSPPTLAQHIAIAAFDDVAVLDARVERYAHNRRILLAALSDLGVEDVAPCDGAFYAYGRVDHWGIDSFELVQRWLAEIGVAAAPGVDFDHRDGHRWVRWSFAGSTEDVTEGCERLRTWANRRG